MPPPEISVPEPEPEPEPGVFVYVRHVLCAKENSQPEIKYTGSLFL